MTNVIVAGLQWGDEGKGKIIDWLAEHAGVVVRFQGGNNAGHTLVVDGCVHKLSLLPSGVVRKGTLNIIGNGVVLNPWALLEEIQTLQGNSVVVTPDNLMIAENTPLLLPFHVDLDRAREACFDSAKTHEGNNDNLVQCIGTTGRGISPAYEDKIGRRAVRIGEIADQATIENRLLRTAQHHDVLRSAFGLPAFDWQALSHDLSVIASELLPFVQTSAKFFATVQAKIAAKHHILFEGAQGALLDIDFGTYPFVTSSNTIAPMAFVGSGLGYTMHENPLCVLGVVKAYTTRVGEGPFPTELNDQMGNILAERGFERGTVTGRPRRCGWFDAALLRNICRFSGVTCIAMTKLDVLDTFETFLIGTGYKYKGQNLKALPLNEHQYADLQPIYESISGWQTNTRGVRSWSDLPAQAQAYIKRIEEIIECPIAIVSTSPEREDTIMLRDPFSVSSI